MINTQNPDFSNSPVSPFRPKFRYFPRDLYIEPVISIVTPFYDTKEVFHETARSVLNQSFQEWEWIIVNDGSTSSKALAVLDKYRDGDPRIRVIDIEENQGLSTARNTGVKKATSEYILFLDSDDLLEPTATEKWLWFLYTHPEFSFVKGYSVGFGINPYLWSRGFHDGNAFLKENLVEATSLLRKTIFSTVGGFDESNHGGLEDWDFWLKCASHGYWGDTIPEYHSWYRRRSNQEVRWSNWSKKNFRKHFLKTARLKYPNLWKGDFPDIKKHWHQPYDQVQFSLSFKNLLASPKQRILMILPWLNMGGADKYNLDLIQQLKKRDWEITIIATDNGEHTWENDFFQLTPDIFILSRFLNLTDYPRFIEYLIKSRNPDIVFVSNSEIGYMLLPYLRASCPKQTFVDYCHMEEENWKNGGYARKSIVYQEQLNLTIVASEHLKKWILKNGSKEKYIEVSYINVDTDLLVPNPDMREWVCEEYNLEESTNIILFAGRLTEQKQPLVLLYALTHLIKKADNFVALVAGNGPMKNNMKHFIRKHKALKHKVKILGELPHAEVVELMQAADIFFLPSKQEGISLAIYEAMACGVVVVGADVGGQKELLTSNCGKLIPKSTEMLESREYAEIIHELLIKKDERRKYAKRARERVEREFNINDMGNRMVTLFEYAKNKNKDLPLLSVPIELGRVSAQEAIESVRLFYLAEQLWHGQYQQEAPFSIRLYFFIRKLFLPFYLRAGGDNNAFLYSVKRRVKKIF